MLSVEKECSGCGETRPPEDFWKGSGKGGRTAKCKFCLRKEQPWDPAKWTRMTPEAREARNDRKKESHVRQRYGVTLEWFNEKLAQQNGKCALCDEPPTHNRLHIDHDHRTGALRDLLCNRCNLGIGQFKDDPALLRRAADYVERHATSEEST